MKPDRRVRSSLLFSSCALLNGVERTIGMSGVVDKVKKSWRMPFLLLRLIAPSPGGCGRRRSGPPRCGSGWRDNPHRRGYRFPAEDRAYSPSQSSTARFSMNRRLSFFWTRSTASILGSAARRILVGSIFLLPACGHGDGHSELGHPRGSASR